MSATLDPAQCTTMAEVRAGVDELDRRIVALLQRRFGYMDAAARTKRLHAVWEELMEQSIAYELERFDETR